MHPGTIDLQQVGKQLRVSGDDFRQPNRGPAEGFHQMTRFDLGGENDGSELGHLCPLSQN
jgi:hypothetical protein